ncbi:hypothetical protein [Mycolicibacterium sp. CBMA 226]|uniref:hypothetical protein n=1 Tax=Mycolicibacterium sp. CBMA 226 TaxID=2606611 RepID=UPI001AA1D1EB|nr:hypothetical protein [Mycolicibacterium sp. CBMA 226]
MPRLLDAFAAVNAAASEAITAAGAADSNAMLGSVAAAIGPIGATYLAAYAPAQANNLTSTLLVGAAHAGVSAATDAAKVSFQRTDQA